MSLIFQSHLWQISLCSPWKALNTEHCVEINQPEGTGALHISGYRKSNGLVSAEETLRAIKDEIPVDTEINPVQLGDFNGYCAEYTNWTENVYWKKWAVSHRKVLLFITYNCAQADENFEADQVLTILKTLRGRE